MTATWEPGIGDHLRTIWRYRYVVLAGAFAVAGLVFAWRSSAEEVFEAQASVRITVLSDGGLALDEDRAEYASRIYAELAESPQLIVEAIENSGIDLTRSQGARLLDVEWARPPGFIDITASGPSPAEAAALADGMSAALVAAVQRDVSALEALAEPTAELADATGDDATVGGTADGGAAVDDAAADSDGAQTRSASEGLSLTAVVVEPALLPRSPAAPVPVRDAIVAFIVASFVLAEGAALWRPARGLLPLARTAERVTDLVGVPCLTLTGDTEDRTRLTLFASRYLADTQAALVVQCKGRPLPAAAVRLAEAVASGGRRSLVIDGDAPSPVLHERLGLPRGPGLVEVFAGERHLIDSVFASPSKSNMWLLTAGGRHSDDVRAPLPRERALERLEIGSRFDFVAVSIGSASVPDGLASAVAELRGSTILVIDPERTKRTELSEFVHGFGGQDDVVAVLLLTEAAATAETGRLAARWHRTTTNGQGSTIPIPRPNKRRASRL